MVEPNIPQKLYDFPDQLPVKTYSEIVQEIQNGLVSHGAGISPRKTLQSTNFVQGVSGWRIDTNGNVEFQDGVFRGNFSIGGTTITIDNTEDIQENLDTIEAEGGGTLYLQPGTYVLTSDLIMPGSVTLEGVSRDGVIIDGNNAYSIVISGTDSYTTGTVTISPGDTEVVGGSTVWTSAMVGRYIFLGGFWYEITARTDNTHITIGSAYTGVALSASGYAIATPNFNPTLRKLTITNSDAGGIECIYASEPWFDDIYVYGCATGYDLDYVYAPRLFTSSFENDVNCNFNYVYSFQVNFSAFEDSTSGAGVVMTNSGNATFFDSSVSGNTGDGINLTSCTNIAFLSITASSNGGQGIEFVSGNSDIQLVAFTCDGNTSDGIKFTATSDRNIISNCSVINNGGYGINIAASTCDNNQIIAPAFDNNTSGNINDQGTNTFVSPQETGVDVQTFTSTGAGTWTKPSGDYDFVRVQVWAGGGSGASGQNGAAGGGGGGGGSYAEKTFAIGDLASSESLSVGAGGAAVSGTNVHGNVGGNSTFSSSSTLITAYGGGGGGSGNEGGGGGGGIQGVGASGASNTGHGGVPRGYVTSTIQSGTAFGTTLPGGNGSVAGGGGGGGGGGTPPGRGGDGALYGGGGGGGGAVTTGATAIGGNSFWGGGGGGGGAAVTTGGAGGTSVQGGNGGAGAIDSNNGTAGSVPGGGGGGSEAGTSGAGGNGKIIVTTY